MFSGGLHNAGQPSGVRTTALALGVVVCLVAAPTLTAARVDGVVDRATISLTSNSFHHLRDGKPAAVNIFPDPDLLSNAIPRDGAVAAAVAAVAAASASVAAAVKPDDFIPIPTDTVTAALGWPDGRPDRSDSDVELLPVRSGDLIGLRAKDMDLFCNVRDVSANIPSTTTTTTTALRSAMVCGEQYLDGPGGSLLVVGANFLSDEIETNKGTFYIKSQRANKFCSVVAADSLGLLEDDDEGMDLEEDDSDFGADGTTQQQRQQGGRLVVTCDQAHYDDACEWRASVSRTDPRVIFLHPANPSAVGSASAANRGGVLTCAPRGRDGLMVCDERTKPSGRKAEMEVVKAGYRPDGGDDGGNPYYPGGGDDDGGNPYYHGGGDDGGNPYYPGGGGDGGNPYYHGGGYLQTTAGLLEKPKDTGSDAGNQYYPGGGGGHSGKAKRDKLPFRTGAIVRLASPCLDSVCDTADSPSPYGPYGPGGAVATAVRPTGGASDAAAASTRAATSILGRRGGGGSSNTITHGAVDSNPYYPYDDGGDDDDLLASVVWCNASVPDSGLHDYPSWGSATANAAAGATATGIATGGSSSDGKVQGSKWDLDGYVLMGTDFATADLYDGSRVYLKNQNTRKFCRVTEDRVLKGVPTATAAATAAAADDDNNNNNVATNDLSRHHGGRGGRGDDGAWALVCDRTRSDRETELVLELVEVEMEVEVEVGGSGGGKGGSGGGYWPPSGGGGEKTSVLVRLRGPGNDMRYCAPQRSLPGAPITCNLHRPDPRRHGITTFRLVDAVTRYHTSTTAAAAPLLDPANT